MDISSNTSSEDLIRYIDQNNNNNNNNNISSKPKLLDDKSNNKNSKKRQESSDTDYYLNLIANDNKQLKQESVSEKTSSLSDITEKSETSSITRKSSSSSSRKSSVASFTRLDFNDSKRKSKKSSKLKSKDRSKDRSKIRSKIRSKDRSKDKKKSHKVKTFNDSSTKKILTPQEVKMRKIELLRKLSEIKSKGYNLSKSYDFNSSIEEMEYEYDLLRSFASKRNGVKLYKNILLNVTSVIEFLNDTYDPFNFKLSGWSEHLSVEVDSYDEVLEELYEKYKGKGKGMPPEIK